MVCLDLLRRVLVDCLVGGISGIPFCEDLLTRPRVAVQMARRDLICRGSTETPAARPRLNRGYY